MNARESVRIGRSVGYAAVELLLMFPYAAVLHHALQSSRLLGVCLLLLLVSHLAGWLAAAWTRRMWLAVPLGLASTVVWLYVPAFASASADPAWHAAVWMCAGGWMAIRGIRTRVAREHIGWLSMKIYAAGMVAYVLLAAYMGLQPEALAGYRGILAAAGGASLIVLFVDMNRRVLVQENLARSRQERPSASVRRTNRGWTALLLVCTFLVGTAWFIPEALRRLWRWLISLLPESKPPVEPEPEPSAPPDSGQGMPPLEPGEPHWIWVLLEWVMWVLFAVGLLIGAAYLLRWLWRRALPALFAAVRRWIARLTRRLPDEDDFGYEDEQEKLDRPERVGLGSILKRLGLRRRGAEAADNAGKLRELYADTVRQAGRKGYKHQPSLTPSETGERWSQSGIKLDVPAAPLVRLYNRVRYGGRPPSDEELRELRERKG